MNDNDKLNAIFDPRDGDPHHSAAQEDDEPITWPEIGLVVALVASVAGLTWWLS